MTQVAKHTTHGFLSGFFLAAQAALGQAQTAHADTSASLSPRLIPADVRRGSGHEGSGEDYEFTIGNLSARLLTIGIQLPPPPTMTKNRADLFCGFSALAGSRYCGQTRNAGIVLADNNLD